MICAVWLDSNYKVCLSVVIERCDEDKIIEGNSDTEGIYTESLAEIT